ncbi:MAG TPA: hypothetical protein PKA64_14590, partial [Myxococcota bacterium]|nr:hypothetical protein [Myxococcota bacterium]
MRVGWMLGVACASPAGSSAGPSPSRPPPAEAPAWACALASGPLDVSVRPGRYDATYAYRQDKLITMERTASTSVDGQAWLDLGADGGFAGCVGAIVSRSRAVSRYASADGQDHHEGDRVVHLLGLRGTWSQELDGARLRVDGLTWGACDGEMREAALELRCGALRDPDRIACRGEAPQLPPILLDLGSSARAGPTLTRDDPSARAGGDDAPACGPW